MSKREKTNIPGKLHNENNTGSQKLPYPRLLIFKKLNLEGAFPHNLLTWNLSRLLFVNSGSAYFKTVHLMW